MDSPRKTGGASKSKLNLNQRECELLAAAWLSTQNPQIDWDKFADLAGFKNAKSARTCFGPLKKKLQEQYGGGFNGPALSKDSVAKSRTPKKKAADMVDDTGDDQVDKDSNQSPTKKVKKNHNSANSDTEQEGDDEEGLV